MVPELTLLVSQGLVKNRCLGEKGIGKEYPGLILNLLGVKLRRLVFCFNHESPEDLKVQKQLFLLVA